MLRSEHFARSPRMSRFLRYVVEASLDGRAHELKETTIGHAVFDRPADYDPKDDAIVRVEARRLRSRIMEYYEGRPLGPVRIVLPKGTYVPVFAPAAGLSATPATALSPESADPSPPQDTTQQAPSYGPASGTVIAASPQPVSIPVDVMATPRRRWRPYWALAACAVVVGIIGLAFSLRDPNPTEEQLLADAKPFANLPGFPQHPRFAPGGGAVAFDWAGPDSDNLDIYLQLLDGDAPARVTTHPLPESQPAWSPDGSQVAFLRAAEDESAIVVHTLVGGQERVVARLKLRRGERPRLDWSPDGRYLLSSERESPDGPHRLVLVNASTGDTRTLTPPPPDTLGDSEGAFSPDSQWVAFRRAIRPNVEDVFIVNLSGSSLKRITEDNRGVAGLCWSATGKALIISSDRQRTGRQLWRFPIQGGPPAPLTPPAMMANSPTVPVRGNRIAFVQSYEDRNIYRLDLDVAKPGEPRLIADSLTRDCDPDLAPDGRTLVFRSDRSGSDDLWAQDVTSGKVRRITRWDGGLVGSPAVSPDGKQVAFNASRGANSSIYLVSMDGGEPRRFSTSDQVHETSPQWSPDGRFLYFSSNRSGSQELWRAPVAGGSAQQITIGTGTNGYATPDGQSLFYARTQNGPGIYRLSLRESLPAEGTRVIEAPPGFIGHWELGDRSLFYVLPSGQGSASLHQMDPETGRKLAPIPLPGYPAAYDGGLAISPDGATVYYTTLDRAGSNIMIAGDSGRPR